MSTFLKDGAAPAAAQETAVRLLTDKLKTKQIILSFTRSLELPGFVDTIYQFGAVSVEQPNMPVATVLVNAEGGAIAEERLSDLARIVAADFYDAEPLRAVRPEPVDGVITITPSVNDLRLCPGETLAEKLSVFIPKEAGVRRADVYFLADTTGSMGAYLNAVKTGAANIFSALTGLGIDIAFGAGNYKDNTDPYFFQHQQALTTDTSLVTAAINSWTASGGADTPEGQFFALNALAQPPGTSIGWRANSKRIIVWFGDAPGHDPICASMTGLPYNITEALVTNKLVDQNIAVLAISVNGNGLNADPDPISSSYPGSCPPNGNPNQAVNIAAATGGQSVSGINASQIVTTIVNLVTAAVNTINNVSLVPTGDIIPFVTSIDPAGGYGPLTRDRDHTLPFAVLFTGVVKCADKDQEFFGTLDVVVDGVVVAQKRVRIVVPACTSCKRYVYSVKYVCGIQDFDSKDAPVRPAFYATEINIHNYNSKDANIRKHVLPLVDRGEVLGREPRYVKPEAFDAILLPSDTATLDDCTRLQELLYGGSNPDAKLMIGFLEIISDVELNVTAVYTAASLETKQLVSMDVEQFTGKVRG
ncbi:MAG: hypothetical protein IM638_19135 [Bacteroidetes bacterium]|nr:hypothetical protein [Bacteroidota bacterium]